MSGGTMSGRVESSWPNFTNVGPSSSSIPRGGGLCRLPPEPHHLAADELAGLLVAGAIPRQVVELDRIAEDERAEPPVSRRPAERVEAERNDRSALLHRDHQPADLNRARIAEALPRAFDMDADDAAVPHRLTRLANGITVALATSDRDHAHPGECLAEHGDLEQLRLGEEVGHPGNECADQRMVDAREVIGGEDAAAV